MPKDSDRRRLVVEEVSSADPVKVEVTVGPTEETEKETPHVEEQIVEEKEEMVPETKVPEVAETPSEETPEEKPAPVEIPHTTPEIPIQQPGGTNPLWVIIPGIFLLGALLGGIIFYQKSFSGTTNTTESPAPIESTMPAETPTPSPEAKADLTKYKISVLNGSGISGEAGKVKTLLEDAGFSVSSTANADDYSYTKTIISAKSSVDKAFLEALTTALNKNYVVGTTATLSASSKDNVTVTVGSTKAK